jgi:C4-dicarboxylate-specific signal transduction histidine kinase
VFIAYSVLRENQKKLLISEKMASLGRLTAGIVHDIVVGQFGGTIEVTSQLGRGATFKLEFPNSKGVHDPQIKK